MFLSFSLSEVQCLNETQKYLRKVVHEIGLELRSTAVCTAVRRTREGFFTLQDALLHHHWTAADIQQAIRQYHATKKTWKHRNHTQTKFLAPPREKEVSRSPDETSQAAAAADSVNK